MRTKQSPNSHEPGWELGREFAAQSQKRFATKSYIMIILWVCLIFLLHEYTIIYINVATSWNQWQKQSSSFRGFSCFPRWAASLRLIPQQHSSHQQPMLRITSSVQYTVQRCSELSIDSKHDSIVIYCLFSQLFPWQCFFCERGNWRPNDHYMIIQCGVLDLPLIGLWAIRIDSERGQRKALATLALHASALWGNKKSSCVDGGCFFLYMLETRTWIDVSCLWTWLCFQTCTPKTKVEVRLQRFWLMKVVRLVQCNFKHAHLISIAMPEITICAMHTDCKPRPSRSPSFKLHGLAMESRISGSSHFYVRSSISIFFNPHLNLACSVALAVWNNCVLINIQCKSKCNSLRPLDMICHVCWTIESCLVIHLLTGYNRFKGYQSPRHQCFYSTSTSQSQPAFAVWTFPTSCSDVLSTKVGKRHMQHTHAYARKYMCFPAESFVTWCRPTIACHELR